MLFNQDSYQPTSIMESNKFFSLNLLQVFFKKHRDRSSRPGWQHWRWISSTWMAWISFVPGKVPPNLLISFPNSSTKFLNTSSMSYVVVLSIDTIKGNKPSSTGMMNSNISRSNEIMENTCGIWSYVSKNIETMDDRFIHTLQVSQWFNLWHSYQPIFQLATKIDVQYVFFAARIMIRFRQINY